MTFINNLVNEYLNKPVVAVPIMSSASRSMQQILLTNDIGPNSKVTALMQDEVSGRKFAVLFPRFARFTSSCCVLELYFMGN